MVLMFGWLALSRFQVAEQMWEGFHQRLRVVDAQKSQLDDGAAVMPLEEWMASVRELTRQVTEQVRDSSRLAVTYARIGWILLLVFMLTAIAVIVLARQRIRLAYEQTCRLQSLLEEQRLAAITTSDMQEQQERIRIALEDARKAAESALERERAMQENLVEAKKMAALGGLVAGVAHEINTPVGVTLSAATHLESETIKTACAYETGDLTEEALNDYFANAREATRMMTFNCQRASELIQGFKQVAVDQSGGERRTFDLAIYIDEVLLSLRPRWKRSKVTVTAHCPPGLILDSKPGAFSQLLTNLIENSLLHAFDPEQGGQIEIRVTPVADAGIEMVYRDNGKGIPAELHAKVFDPFFTTRRGSGGSGLGLHIVYNLVHQTLLGTLKLESRPQEGTTFTMRLPRMLPERAAS
ncbi:MAG: HAMP domain-containing histidine kinase [Magnetococcales bacterium]|nr:HAMP domain-containing histidine kinase [Magnetococcales bacterium]